MKRFFAIVVIFGSSLLAMDQKEFVSFDKLRTNESEDLSAAFTAEHGRSIRMNGEKENTKVEPVIRPLSPLSALGDSTLASMEAMHQPQPSPAFVSAKPASKLTISRDADGNAADSSDDEDESVRGRTKSLEMLLEGIKYFGKKNIELTRLQKKLLREIMVAASQVKNYEYRTNHTKTTCTEENQSECVLRTSFNVEQSWLKGDRTSSDQFSFFMDMEGSDDLAALMGEIQTMAISHICEHQKQELANFKKAERKS